MKFNPSFRRSASILSLCALLFPFTLSQSICALELPAAPALRGADYLSLLKNRVTWSRLPVSVYFARDAEYSASRERAARAGFSLWEQATDGYVCFNVQDYPEHAQIVVRFDPETNDGHTTTSFTSQRIVGARITIGVEREGECDVQCTAAHEFGHALGLSGHSRNDQDLMYPAHIMGRAWSITRRDLNTLARVYHVDPAVASDWTPQRR